MNLVTTGEVLPEVWLDQFLRVREVPGQGLCGVQRFIHSCGLVTNLTFDELEYDYKARYCFPLGNEAIVALMVWDGEGDPPGEWIKEKVSGRRRIPRDDE
jgi:hypothetical protein